MRHGSLFSGIGGFDLAAQWMGWQNAFHCEYNLFCQRILKHYWPNAATYTDIRETDFTVWRGQIDILTGGFPCQPYSTAGKRRGKDDDRHLWPEMLRAIREIRPRWIVGENVRGIISWSKGMVFEEVQDDLEAAGYEVQPFVLPAVAVGAPHRRDRVWFVAHANMHGNDFGFSASELCRSQRPHKEQSGNGRRGKVVRLTEQRIVANSREPRLSFRHKPGNGGAPGAPPKRQELERDAATRDWAEFPTQPPVLPGDDGLSAPVAGYTARQWYNEHIKAAGNAIVPHVALQIFGAIDEYEK